MILIINLSTKFSTLHSLFITLKKYAVIFKKEGVF